MKELPLFQPIDTKTWPQAQEFWYYTQAAPTTYSVTVPLDVTILRRTLKQRDVRFFPAYLWLVTRAVREVPELRVAVREGVLGHWRELTPTYPQFHPDDGSTSLLWTEFDPDFSVFYRRYLEDTAHWGEDHGILTGKGAPPENSYVISCTPWFSFDTDFK